MWSGLGPEMSVVRADLGELIAFGYEIEEHPLLGVAYRGPAHRLCPDQIEHELATKVIGRRIAVWDRVGSTNDLALRAAASRANEGLVVLAESQTQGRGRRGRSWSAPHGTSILMSILIFPAEPLTLLDRLTAVGAVAVAEVVEEWIRAKAQIKWPNDVRIHGKKVAGILVEVDRTGGVVIGIGLNVNVTSTDLPEELRDTTTSLQDLTGTLVDRSEVARALIHRLDYWYTQGLHPDSDQLGEAWKLRSEHVGHLVRVELEEGSICGRVVDIDLKAGLLLEEEATGATRRIPSVMIRSLSPQKLVEVVDPGC